MNLPLLPAPSCAGTESGKDSLRLLRAEEAMSPRVRTPAVEGDGAERLRVAGHKAVDGLAGHPERRGGGVYTLCSIRCYYEP